MDILFENHHRRTRELAKEIYGYYFFKRKLIILAYILLGISFLQNLLTAIFAGYYSVMIFVIAPICATLPVICYFSQVNAMMKRDRELRGGEVEVFFTVTDSIMRFTDSSGNATEVGLDNVKCAVQTKNLILLHSRANLLYVFRKEGFTLGTKEEFILFLKNKGIRVKGK